MDKIIKEIEDMSLNAWPSHKMELYDGWILRFSYFYTHRTNSVEQFGTSTLSWREKVSFCEAEYARLGSPAIFKISPLVSPDFDYLLENRNYEIQHTTNVMAASLDGADLSAPCDLVTLTDDIPDIWIESLFDLKGTINPVHRAVVPSMYHAIVKDTVCVPPSGVTVKLLQPGLEFWIEIILDCTLSMFAKISDTRVMLVRFVLHF